jgi:hypothetical protein
MENQFKETKESKEDKRRQTALENLRKGREKLIKLRQKGFATRTRTKPKKVPKYKTLGIKDSDSDDSDSSDSSDSSEDSSEEEEIKKKKQPKKQKGKGKVNKLKSQVEEMKGIINQLKNSKEPKQKEKVVINMLNPSQPAPAKATDYDTLLKKAMFGNL